jgi:ABC-2 type transport system ATP-binding protein
VTTTPHRGLALEASGLGKRHRSTWALRDCGLAIPEGHVVALVGPNGSGKTTLLHLAVGLATPTTGRAFVQGGLAAGGPEALETVAFVAQDTALYPNLSVADTLHLARNLNPGLDSARANARIAELDIPSARKVGKLSGGQRAQVALTIALAKRPRLLILDEPLASLDPLARHDFLAALMAAVAEDGISIVFSSHVVTELERVCDYLVVLASGRVQVAGEVDDLLATHRLYTGPAARADQIAATLVTACAFAAVVMWWYAPLVGPRGRLGTGSLTYEVYGAVFVARALFALALGIFAGALIRRVVPAIAVTLAGWTAVFTVTVVSLRSYFLTPLTALDAMAPGKSPWVIAERWTAPNGHVLSSEEAFTLQSNTASAAHPQDLYAYLAHQGYHYKASYFPESRFWTFQTIEAGGLVVLSLVLLAATVWLVRRRAA